MMKFADHEIACLAFNPTEKLPWDSTGDLLFIWSGDVFMYLRKNESLKMRVATL
jgi:hypothetical protein